MTVLPETYSMFRASYEMPEDAEPGYTIHQLHTAINDLAEMAKSKEGRERLREDGNSIETALMHLNGIVAFVLRQKA